MTEQERKDLYKSLCHSGKINELFMQPWWLDALGEWDVTLAIKNQQVTGAFPFALKNKWGVHTITMPSLTHHISIWMEKPPDISDHKWLTREKQTIWSLVDNLPKHGFFSMVFAEGSFDNWLPFHWKGFRQEMRYTFVIDHADESTIDQQINRNLKRNLREATSEISVASMNDPKEFHAVCEKTYDRQKMKTPYTFNQFEKLDWAIEEHQAGIKLGAYSNKNEILGVAYLLWDNEKAYYFLAGDTEAGRDSGSGLLLCREALRIAFEEKKLKHFDFCGSMLEPITEIRRQFGARSVPLMKIVKANHKWLDVLYQLTH